MRTIIAVLACLALCGSVYADQGDVYVKANLSLLNIEADLEVETSTTIRESGTIEQLLGEPQYEQYPELHELLIARGWTAGTYTCLNKDEQDGELDGNGVMVELGVGYNILESLFVEGSLAYGSASMDVKNLLETGTVLFDLTIDGVGKKVVPVETYTGYRFDWETDISTFAGMVDVNYVFTDLFMPEDNSFSAFAGVGVGFANNTVDDITIKFVDDLYGPMTATVDGDSSVVFAWRINVGAEYAINEQWSANLTYQYMDLGTAEAGKKFVDNIEEGSLASAPELDLTAQAFSIGATYKF